MNFTTSGVIQQTDRAIAVIVLAGGHSRRWQETAGKPQPAGGDKALALWRGKPLLEHALEPFENICTERIVVLRREQQQLNEYLVQKNARHAPVALHSNNERHQRIECVWDDGQLREGPLRGVICGLKFCRAPRAFVTGCDYPRVHPAILQYFLGELQPQSELIAAEWDGRLQPFPALLRRAALPQLEKILSSGTASIMDAFRQLRAQLIPQTSCAAIDPNGQTWLNFNRQSALENLNDTTNYAP